MPQCGGEGRRSDAYTVTRTVRYGVHLVVLMRSSLIPLGVHCSSPGEPMVDGIEPETTGNVYEAIRISSVWIFSIDEFHWRADCSGDSALYHAHADGS